MIHWSPIYSDLDDDLWLYEIANEMIDSRRVIVEFRLEHRVKWYPNADPAILVRSDSPRASGRYECPRNWVLS